MPVLIARVHNRGDFAASTAEDRVEASPPPPGWVELRFPPMAAVGLRKYTFLQPGSSREHWLSYRLRIFFLMLDELSARKVVWRV